jgi:predicted metal-binding membrane protein
VPGGNAILRAGVLRCHWRHGRLDVDVTEPANPCRTSADSARGTHLLVCGYLLPWFAFGVAAHLLDMAVHEIGARSGWVTSNAWMLGACVLMVASLFQFSRLKYHGLDRCRTPLSFIIRHWHGGTPRRHAFLLGAHHGVFCVGCCWAIMLLMFIVGTGSIGWIIPLGAIMFEKNAAWGRKLSRPLGVALLPGLAGSS